MSKVHNVNVLPTLNRAARRHFVKGCPGNLVALCNLGDRNTRVSHESLDLLDLSRIQLWLSAEVVPVF